MATHASDARRAPEVPRRTSDDRHLRPDLGVFDKRHLRARRDRRKVRVLGVLSGLVMAGSLAVVAVGHALVATDQVRADALQSQISTALANEQALRLDRSELEAPARILSIATRQLGMVTPTSVVYLPPVNPGETVLQAHASATTSQKGHAGQGAEPGSSRGTKS